MMIALSTTLGYTAVMEEQRLHALDERHLAAWRTFITAHAALIDAIERDLRGAGVISLTWYDVLIELAEAPDHRLRLHELARAVVLSRSGLTRLVERLGAAGLIAREPCPDDRRGAFAVLTAEGAVQSGRVRVAEVAREVGRDAARVDRPGRVERRLAGGGEDGVGAAAVFRAGFAAEEAGGFDPVDKSG